MKKQLFPLFFAVLTGLAACSSSDDPIEPANCNGLVTDTIGTGDNGRLYMPTAFTPNGDGLNDTYKPLTQNIASISWSIYEENGTEIFTSTTPGQAWSPSAVPGNSYKKYFFRAQATTSAGNQVSACGDLFKLNDCRPSGATIYFEDQLTVNGFTGVTAEILPLCP